MSASAMKSKTLTCPRCKAEIEISVEYDKKGAYTRCTGCSRTLRLMRTPKAPEHPHHERMSKKERLRKRWEGRESQRFARVSP